MFCSNILNQSYFIWSFLKFLYQEVFFFFFQNGENYFVHLCTQVKSLYWPCCKCKNLIIKSVNTNSAIYVFEFMHLWLNKTNVKYLHRNNSQWILDDKLINYKMIKRKSKRFLDADSNSISNSDFIKLFLQHLMHKKSNLIIRQSHLYQFLHCKQHYQIASLGC